MREFFKGWRRKVGIVTLMIALAFLLGWVRSTIVADFIGMPSGSTTYYVVSHGGLLEFQRTTPAPERTLPAMALEQPKARSTAFATTVPWFGQPPPWIWGSLRLGWYDDKYGVRTGAVDVVWSDFEVEWQRGVGRFQIVAGRSGSRQATKVVVAYWTVAIPLTLLSAHLILWKPRKKAALPPSQDARLN